MCCQLCEDTVLVTVNKLVVTVGHLLLTSDLAGLISVLLLTQAVVEHDRS